MDASLTGKMGSQSERVGGGYSGNWATLGASGVDSAWHVVQAHAGWVKLASKTRFKHLPVAAQARFSKTKEADAQEL